MATIVLTIDRSAERDLAKRAARMTPRGPRVPLTPLERSIHFLRGVHSRATMDLPAFYLFHAAAANTDRACSIPGYAGTVFKHSVSFSALGTVALSCRKAFDHGAKGLTGANFAKSSDGVLQEHAKYWAKHSGCAAVDANAALQLLRSVFRSCAKTDTALFLGAIPLGQSVGLLKQYADRAAAHLSVENYAVTVLDCAHVVATLTLMGEIIRSFDEQASSPSYFDALDEAAFNAARTLFPTTPDLRLFGDMKVAEQARLCWKLGGDRGQQMLFERLPYAMGWY